MSDNLGRDAVAFYFIISRVVRVHCEWAAVSGLGLSLLFSLSLKSLWFLVGFLLRLSLFLSFPFSSSSSSSRLRMIAFLWRPTPYRRLMSVSSSSSSSSLLSSSSSSSRFRARKRERDWPANNEILSVPTARDQAQSRDCFSVLIVSILIIGYGTKNFAVV